jgi:hypothetical protein
MQDSSSGYENRRFSRVPIKLPVTVTPADGEIVSGETRDVSAIGVYVDQVRVLPLGSACKVCIRLRQEAAIDAKGNVTRLEKMGFAVEFSTMSEGSFDSLRELLLDHGEDSPALDAELVSRADLLPETG